MHAIVGRDNMENPRESETEEGQTLNPTSQVNKNYGSVDDDVTVQMAKLIELESQKKQWISESRAKQIAVLVALYTSAAFLGPNYFDNDEDGARMKWMHTVLSLVFNAFLNYRFTYDPIIQTVESVHGVCSDVKARNITGATKGVLDLGLKTILSVCAASIYVPFYKMISPKIYGWELRWTYYLAYVFMNLSGISGLLNNSVYPVIQENFWRLILSLPNNVEHLKKVRTQMTLKQFERDIVMLMRQQVKQANRSVNSGAVVLDEDAVDFDAALIDALNDRNVLKQSQLLPYIVGGISIMVNLFVLYSILGFSRDTIIDQHKDNASGFALFMSNMIPAAAMCAFIGMGGILAKDIAASTCDVAYDIKLGIRPVKAQRLGITLSILAVPLVAILASAALTVEATLKVNELFEDEVAPWFNTLVMAMSYCGTIAFNGTPMAEIVCRFILKKLWKHNQEDNNVYRRFDAVEKAMNGDRDNAIRVCADLEKKSSADGISNIPRIQDYITKKYGINQVAFSSILKNLGNGDREEAAEELIQNDNGLYSAKQSRRYIATHWGVNTIIPAGISCLLIAFALNELSYKDSISEYVGNSILTFLPFMLTSIVKNYAMHRHEYKAVRAGYSSLDNDAKDDDSHSDKPTRATDLLHSTFPLMAGIMAQTVVFSAFGPATGLHDKDFIKGLSRGCGLAVAALNM